MVLGTIWMVGVSVFLMFVLPLGALTPIAAVVGGIAGGWHSGGFCSALGAVVCSIIAVGAIGVLLGVSIASSTFGALAGFGAVVLAIANTLPLAFGAIIGAAVSRLSR
jgi:hypothetical protein